MREKRDSEREREKREIVRGPNREKREIVRGPGREKSEIEGILLGSGEFTALF